MFLTGCTTTPLVTPLSQETELARTLPSRDCEGIRNFFLRDLAKYQHQVDIADAAFNEALWDFDTQAKGYSAAKLISTFETQQKDAYDTILLGRVVALDRATRRVKPAVCYFKEKLNRARDLLEHLILVNKNLISKERANFALQVKLADKNNRFRILPPGAKESLSKTAYWRKLATESNRGNRERLYKLFNSARSVRWIDWGFRDLVLARNEEAQLAGYDNYVDYRFNKSQLDLKSYQDVIQKIKKHLAPVVQKALVAAAKDNKLPQIETWDFPFLLQKILVWDLDEELEDTSEQSAVQFVKEFYAKLGFDLDRYEFREDLFARQNKKPVSQVLALALPEVSNTLRTIASSRPDIRVIANLKSPVGWKDISNTVGDIGKAIYAAEIKQPLALFRRVGLLESEVFGNLLAKIAADRSSLEASLVSATGVPAIRLHPAMETFFKTNELATQVELLHRAMASEFESELYAKPEQDLGELWARLAKEYWGIEVDPFYADWDVETLLTAPVTTPNSVLAILVAEPLYLSAKKEFAGNLLSPLVGEKIRDILFKPGFEFNYAELVPQFTGRPFSLIEALDLVD